MVSAHRTRKILARRGAIPVASEEEINADKKIEALKAETKELEEAKKNASE